MFVQVSVCLYAGMFVQVSAREEAGTDSEEEEETVEGRAAAWQKQGFVRGGGGQRQMRTRTQTEFQTENFRFSIEFFHFLTIDAYPFWLITVHIICDQCSVCT